MFFNPGYHSLLFISQHLFNHTRKYSTGNEFSLRRHLAYMKEVKLANPPKKILIEKRKNKKIRLAPKNTQIYSCVLKKSPAFFRLEYKQEDEQVSLDSGDLVVSDQFQSLNYLWFVPLNDYKCECIQIEFQLKDDDTVYVQEFLLHQFELSLNLDQNCFESTDPKDHMIGKYHWIWGKTQGEDQEVDKTNKQWGGVILADIDKDADNFNFSENHEGGMTELVSLEVGPPFKKVPENLNLELFLESSLSDTHHFELYSGIGKTYRPILGSVNHPVRASSNDIKPSENYKTQTKIDINGGKFYLRALHLPNSFFSGIITIKVKLKKNQKTIAEDHIIVRVAPWIMVPNTQEVVRVHIMRVNSGSQDETSKSERFIKQLQKILGDKLVVEDTSNYEGDRWLRDEFVIGYCQGIKQTMPVVCDGPRDRGLDKYPTQKLLKADVGCVSITGNKRSTLDSFGNLTVSPPLKNYPFGRIIIGASPKQGFKNSPRQVAHQLKSFLHAQQIQSPIEIFSDWLAVGHVDEIINFIPAYDTGKGFKMLIASAKKAVDILSYVYFSEANKVFYSPFEHKKMRSRDILKKWLNKHWEINHRVQFFLDWNRNLLKKELSLSEEDIIDVPVVFKERSSDGRAQSLLPNLVNQLVIVEKTPDNKTLSYSIAPKSYGPVKTSAQGLTLDFNPNNIQYLFEDQLKSDLEQTGHLVYFIDDADLYFKRGGDIHCATNVERKYFSHKKWWKYKPDNAHDI